MRLTEEERKKFYKLVTISKFKKKYGQNNGNTMLLLKKTGASIRDITKKQLDDYIEKVFYQEKNAITIAYIEVLNNTISSEYRKANSLNSLVKNKTYDEVIEDDQLDLSDYRLEFDSCGLPFTFDELLKFMTKMDENEIKQLSDKKKDNDVEKLQKELEKYKDVIRQQKNEIASLYTEKKKTERNLKNKDKDIKELSDKLKQKMKGESEKNQKIEKLEREVEDNKILEKNKLIKFESSVSEVLGEEINGLTCKKILTELSILENQFIESDNLEKLKEIIAAKYATVTYAEGVNQK